MLLLVIAVMALTGSFVLRLSGDGSMYVPVPWLDASIPLPQACFSRSVFGVSCPGCGLTRSFVATAGGDLYGALLLHPMGPAIYLLCLLQVPYRIVEYLGVGRSNRLWTSIKARLDLVMWVLLAGLVVQFLVRMM